MLLCLGSLCFAVSSPITISLSQMKLYATNANTGMQESSYFSGLRADLNAQRVDVIPDPTFANGYEQSPLAKLSPRAFKKMILNEHQKRMRARYLGK